MRYIYAFLPTFLLSVIYYNGIGQIPHSKHGHLYSTVQVSMYSTEYATGAGPHVSFGYNDNSMAFGPGVGVLIMGADQPYIPLYFQMMYTGGKKKLSPMANFRIGKGFYKGSAAFVGEDSYVNAGFYAEALGGLAVKFKKAKIHLFGGVTLMSFHTPAYETNTFHESIFNAGIGFFTTN